MSKFQALVDSDAFVGFFYREDAHHVQARRLFREVRQFRIPIAATNLVIAETATVLSNREGQSTAVAFLDFARTLPVIYITEALEQETFALFRRQTAKRTSIVDCANVVIIQHFAIPSIFSFDRFYTRFHIPTERVTKAT
ncbi:MAG: PIN domain-containing protein [Anaerolineae bacterium]|nr:PIN domain-containing protein [Anaerolineae bacterium]